MPTLRDIKRRIHSVRSTEQITRAMKMIAGARLRRAQERMLAMRPYVRELSRIIAGLLPDLVGDEHTLLERRPARAAGLVLVTPDRGLCGGLPANLLREAGALVDEKRTLGVGVLGFVAGRKGLRALRSREGVEVALAEEGDSEQPPAAAGDRIADALADSFERGRIDEAHMVFAEFRSAASQRVRRVPVLPISREGLLREAPRREGRPDTRVAEVGRPFAGAEFEPDVRGLVEAAVRRQLGATVYRALLEGAASELGARLTAMDAATRNAGELIDDLTLQYNKARQANITKELMDIVGGVEALR